MNPEVEHYIKQQPEEYASICKLLYAEVSKELPEADNKVWHGHPVWFIEGNPIVGFSIEKAGVRLMFWSGSDFEEPALKPGTGKFKDASIFYQSVDQVNTSDLQRWLKKSQQIQWNYRDIVKNKGRLDPL